ncbi:esterase family protein [Carboxylicivirga mesophila]|uniref:Esterase family protein n=1 Tax=Carboxylicivirga mesophila TaxID=1166478 RepID=A0ABS5KE35_9BACT|nr:alpha/beta hydrolase family protein [Carboxylicivirga mesophila]MBS2213314.1 esterase family protein [Carboxylicivirga mesophila]
MKKLFLLAIVLVTISASAQTPKGKVIEGQSIASKITGYDVNYSVYLPPCYESSERAYPVLYLLHGYSDNETAWVQFGEVNRTADKAIEEGLIPPMIIIMPNAKVTWYVNKFDGNDRYEDMFFEEFIPQVEKQYRIRSQKEFRAISGLSMGGNGSLLYAIRHPEMFGACAAFSAAVYTNEEMKHHLQEGNKAWFEPIYGPLTKKGELPQHWMNYNILNTLQNNPIDKVKRVRFYIDCGDDDFLYKGNAALHVLMHDLKIKHEFRIREGAHNWTYWRTNIIHGLQFVGDTFHRL